MKSTNDQPPNAFFVLIACYFICFDCTILNCFDPFKPWSTAVYHTGPRWATVVLSVLIPGFRAGMILIGEVNIASNIETFMRIELFLIGRMSNSV